MCYHTSLNVPQTALEARYQAQMPESKRWDPLIHANAYAVPVWPLVTAQQPGTFDMHIWGLIPG